MKSQLFLATVLTLSWGIFMASQTSLVAAIKSVSRPITYPVTYPVTYPKPTPTPTPTVRPTPSPISTPKPDFYPVHLETRTVKLTADDFYILAGNKKYTTLGNESPVKILSDPGNPAYTTLEVTWQDEGIEMRLYIYFNSDGKTWKSDEIRTYNGAKQGNWIYYKGTYFQSPLGKSYTNSNFTISSTSGAIKGAIHFTNLKLQAFTAVTPTPKPIVTPTPAPIQTRFVVKGKVNYIKLAYVEKFTPTSTRVAATNLKTTKTYYAAVDAKGNYHVSLDEGKYEFKVQGGPRVWFINSPRKVVVTKDTPKVDFLGLIF